MARAYAKSKGRAQTRRFLGIPHVYLEHENFSRLSPRATKLFIDIAMQYTGRNNGDLAATLSQLRLRGWRSAETLRLALDELVHYGWLIVTRPGALNRVCTLYALSFHSIDECAGKLEISPTTTAPANWKQPAEKWAKPTAYQEIDRRRREKIQLRITKRKRTAMTDLRPHSYGLRSCAGHFGLSIASDYEHLLYIYQSTMHLINQENT